MNLPLGLNADAWSRWVEYRKMLKKPYKTAYAIECAQKKLASFGDYQMQTVEHCMEREWRGLFPLPKEVIADLERRRRDDGKTARQMAELASRASQVGFRQPFKGEDLLGYRTLVERAEHQHAVSRPRGPQSIADLLGRTA